MDTTDILTAFHLALDFNRQGTNCTAVDFCEVICRELTKRIHDHRAAVQQIKADVSLQDKEETHLTKGKRK